MQNPLQPPSRCIILKHKPGKRGTNQATLPIQHPRAETQSNLLQRLLSRLNQLPGKIIGIHHPDTPMQKATGGSGFAHSNAAR
jgi:hypothetical protein